jgi:outer membrane protein assembly factor BamB
MTARRHIGALVPLVALLSSCHLAAEDWPQWRGPSSLGVSAEQGLPERWSAAENVAWKAKLAGSGASSAVVTGGLVVVTSQIGSYRTSNSGDPLLARDDQSLAAREQAMSTSPMASGNRGGEVFLAVEAFRASDGRRVWEYRIRAAGELPKLHEKHNLATPTPVSDGERIYAWFGNGQLVALDVQGRELWKRHLGRAASARRRFPPRSFTAAPSI